MNPQFWSGKRVFLTGHTGFKGSWLSLWLQSLGVDLTGFALEPPTNPSLFEKAHVASKMTSVLGDIRDLGKLTKAMQVAQPEIVIHMAAQSLVPYSYQNPVETYTTNVIGTVNLLEAVRSVSSVRAVLNITTDKCYENREWVWGYRETDRLGGYDPYSSSKACAELVSAAYRSSYFENANDSTQRIALATARAGNVIGGGDWTKGRLVPDTIAALEQGLPLLIRNPHAIRPWQHVLEPLWGYLLLVENLVQGGSDFAESWNFGPDSESSESVAWVVDQLAARWGSEAKYHVDAENQLHETGMLRLDSSKARKFLRWRPVLSLGDSLDMIVDWAKQHKLGTDMRTVTQLQIKKYQSLILG